MSGKKRFLRLVFALSALAILLVLARPLPEKITESEAPNSIRILDRNSELLYESRGDSGGSFKHAELDQISPVLIKAVIAIEDRRFYSHGGVSALAVLRAAKQNLFALRIVSGGSTITQQLIRNLLEPRQRTFIYKIKEAIYAVKLELRLSKDEIMERYLNTAYFGHLAYGISAAAQTYFGKTPAELSLAESALLAGVIQAPSRLDPFTNLQGAKKRRQMVLGAMREMGIIDADQETQSLAEPIKLADGRIPIRAPHFVMWLESSRPDSFMQGGELRTTIDLNLQSEIESIIARKLKELSGNNVTSSAVIVLDARTGELLSMIGSADYFDRDNDGAVNAAVSPRQPGSAIKPFTYALALENGDTSATTVADIETQFFTQEGNPYTPRNYDYGYHGLVRYREALANSYNISAVKVLEKVSVPRLLNFLRATGISTLSKDPDYYGLALTLGDAEVTLLDLAKAYAIFARGGMSMSLKLLESDRQTNVERLLDPRTAWLINDILSDSSARTPEFGEDSPLDFPFQAAAKTGTTRNSRDNWTVGYTPDRIVGVWVGNADNSPMRGTSGITGAGPIFHDAMIATMRSAEPTPFMRPPGLSKVTICRLSGKLPTRDCPHTISEWFIEGTEPKEYDDMFFRVRIDKRNGLLAGEDCGNEFSEDRIFTVFPARLKTWARENGFREPPKNQSPLCLSQKGIKPEPVEAGWIEIIKPGQNDSFMLDPLIPDESEGIIFQAQAGSQIQKIDWILDGKKEGEGTAPYFRFKWNPIPGKFTVEARSGEYSDKRSFEVIAQ